MARNSTASNPRSDSILSTIALGGVGLYLVASALTYRIGFPLDDSWIHLTYARNLALHGEWAFRLGQPSAGSTSPLWTLLLSIGYLIRLAPHLWVYLIGWIILSALAVFAENFARKFIADYKSSFPFVGLFFVLEWHLIWMALSGMETLLHGFVILIALTVLLNDPRRYMTLGLLTGFSVWIRPDGLTLLGPILFTAFLQEDSWRARGGALLKILIGFGVLFVPYLFFNLAISGKPMPNTFYAKQAEYAASWNSEPLSKRVADYALPFVVGPFVVLLPGLFLWIYKIIREKNLGAVAGLIWFVGYVGLYFMRLPAYQHGRYIMPSMPILFFWAMLGFIEFLYSKPDFKFKRMLSLFWRVLMVATLLLFIVIGAQTYASDVALIESEMVDTANWCRINLPPNATLAVHDIGAMGYFDNHRLVDLAGLISPEVVPFIRDETKITGYLNARGADYLITFPAFYPTLTAQHERVFTTNGRFAPELGGENMGVYRWR